MREFGAHIRMGRRKCRVPLLKCVWSWLDKNQSLRKFPQHCPIIIRPMDFIHSQLYCTISIILIMPGNSHIINLPMCECVCVCKTDLSLSAAANPLPAIHRTRVRGLFHSNMTDLRGPFTRASFCEKSAADITDL